MAPRVRPVCSATAAVGAALRGHPTFDWRCSMQRTLLSLALIATAGVSYAQTMPAGEPVDPYGRPLVGRNDWVRQPGDQPGPRGAAMQPGMQPGMQSTAPATTTVTTYS